MFGEFACLKLFESKQIERPDKNSHDGNNSFDFTVKALGTASEPRNVMTQIRVLSFSNTESVHNLGHFNRFERYQIPQIILQKLNLPRETQYFK